MALCDGYVEEKMGRDEMRALQYDIARGEEISVKWGTVGIKEGASRVLGFGDRDGTRLPLKGSLPDGEWSQWEEIFDILGKREKGFAKRAGA